MRLSGVFGTKNWREGAVGGNRKPPATAYRRQLRAGMTPAEARRRAVIALGGVEGTKEAYRDRRGLPAFESMLRDLRYGIRTLVKSARICPCRRGDSRPRHRRQHRDLHGGERRGVEAAAVRRRRAHRARLAYAAPVDCSRRRVRALARQLHRLGSAEPGRSSGWRSIAGRRR